MSTARRPRVTAMIGAAGVLAGAAWTLSITAATAGGAPAAYGTPSGTESTIGSAGGGDQYYPMAGNGGIDAQHYDLDLSYTPEKYLPKAIRDQYHLLKGEHLGRIEGTATVAIRATQPLTRFDLDLSSTLHVRSVTINGHAVAYAHRADGELVITPQRLIAPGTRVSVAVAYGAIIRRPPVVNGFSTGLIPTADGVVLSAEPTGAPTWFPCNDLPHDKATYAVNLTVPRGLVGVSNGLPVGKRTTGNTTAYQWRTNDPMAPYLAEIAVGNYRIITRSAMGVPIYDYIDRDIPSGRQRKIDAVLAKVPQMMRYLSGQFGPYPFSSYGHIVDKDLQAGASMENQTRTLLMTDEADEATVAHELTHQWFGDQVALGQWRDIWLNESFATWGEWLWRHHSTTDHESLAASYREAVRDMSGSWQTVVTDPGADDLFSDAVYARGGAMLYRLDRLIGDSAMSTILHQWVSMRRRQPASTAQFVTLATRVSGRDLSGLFEPWLFQPGKPRGA